ncbi:MAG: hypothetical protein LBG59_03895 [Candidatus Peribacteria bacterium]|jgi:broad specificity phosphatase PhoE|nr:hypothetical protein [Candidatus Peribacteria bacterium]
MKPRKHLINPETGKENPYLSDMLGRDYRRRKRNRLEETRFTDGDNKYAQHYRQVNNAVADIFQQSRSTNVLHTTSAHILHTLNNEMVPVKEGSYEHKIPVNSNVDYAQAA